MRVTGIVASISSFSAECGPEKSEPVLYELSLSVQ